MGQSGCKPTGVANSAGSVLIALRRPSVLDCTMSRADRTGDTERRPSGGGNLGERSLLFASALSDSPLRQAALCAGTTPRCGPA